MPKGLPMPRPWRFSGIIAKGERPEQGSQLLALQVMDVDFGLEAMTGIERVEFLENFFILLALRLLFEPMVDRSKVDLLPDRIPFPAAQPAVIVHTGHEFVNPALLRNHGLVNVTGVEAGLGGAEAHGLRLGRAYGAGHFCGCETDATLEPGFIVVDGAEHQLGQIALVGKMVGAAVAYHVVQRMRIGQAEHHRQTDGAHPPALGIVLLGDVKDGNLEGLGHFLSPVFLPIIRITVDIQEPPHDFVIHWKRFGLLVKNEFQVLRSALFTLGATIPLGLAGEYQAALFLAPSPVWWRSNDPGWPFCFLRMDPSKAG